MRRTVRLSPAGNGGKVLAMGEPVSLKADRLFCFPQEVTASKDRLLAVRADPLHQLERDPLGTFEEAEPAADVVHLVAEHLHPVGLQIGRDRHDVVDPECDVVVAASPPIGRVRAGTPPSIVAT